MLPAFNHSHVLPPFLGSDPTQAAGRAPYLTSMQELAQGFGHLAERRRLLHGLLAYRADLASLGFVHGFQWLDGSFAENVEAQAQRSPSDIDLVTFVHAPAGLSTPQINTLLDAHPDLFIAARAKARYGCDAYVVPLGKSPENLVQRVCYYFGLFSHRRGDHVWKGVLQVPLTGGGANDGTNEDAQAREILDNIAPGENHATA